MTDVYVVRNDSGGSLELKDFGLVIPDTVLVELGDFQKAILSAELQALIQSDDFVKVVSGVDIPKANALLHRLLFENSRSGDSSHSFATWQDDLTISIPSASTKKFRISFQMEYENDTKDKLTEVRLVVDSTVLSCEATSFTDKDKDNPKSFSGYWDYQFTGAQDIKLQSQVTGGTITTRNATITVEVI